MSSFFTTPASQKKRKRANAGSSHSLKKRNTASNAPPRNQRRRDDSSISGSDSADEDGDQSEAGSAERSVSESEESDAAADTEAERRLKLAERYLENVRADVEADRDGIGFDAEDVDRDLIAARLKEDVAEGKGRLYRKIAGELDFERAEKKWCRADTRSVTGVACCSPYLYTVSKNDMTLIKWEIFEPPRNRLSDHDQNRSNDKSAGWRKPKQLLYTKGRRHPNKGPHSHHHTAPILCVAASADGRLVATGGMDRKLIIWDAETLSPLKTFTQHRDAVTGLAFRGKTNQLFTASKDRSVRVWSLNELAFVETLFGHQDEVVDVAAVGGPQERCVSVGARDRTARLWKVVEESSMVFRGGGSGQRSAKKTQTDDEKPQENGRIREADDWQPQGHHEGSLDRVIQIDSHLFVTGSDSGALALYGLHKKKPLHVYPLAHGLEPPLEVGESSAEAVLAGVKTQGKPTPRWITALAVIPFSDLFLSGSWDGYVRAWKISDDQKRIESAGVLGQVEAVANDDFEVDGLKGVGAQDPARIKGFINDLAVFQRGDRGRDGLCVVAGVGSEPRMGRWLTVKAKPGAAVFEIPRRTLVIGLTADAESPAPMD